ncbi:MAG: hypothetical protein J0M15_08660 [Deltaproteobacteria bacterium]|nr:hypothetical protein [Deltaproteobacteria bacterium]
MDTYNSLPSKEETKANKSLETLIQMNELANEKLKVSIRRLSYAENEIEILKNKLKELEANNQNLQDQEFINFEKEKTRNAQLKQLQDENEILKIQHSLITSREVDLRNETHRLRKYQEKINTQVKPYFKELKEYSKNLELQIQKISEVNERKEVQIQDLKNRVSDMIDNFNFQIETEKTRNEKVISRYEEIVSQNHQDLTKQKENIHFLNSKVEDLEHYHQKFLETENKLIEMERFFSEKRIQYEKTTQDLNDKIAALQRLEYKYETENKDLKLTTKKLFDENTKTKEDLFNTEKQLESLKYLWDQKNSELIKYKQAMDSLEKINIELSKNLSSKNNCLI